MNTSELTDEQLDYWVAKAEGFAPTIEKRWPTPKAAVLGEPPTLCWVAGWKIVGPLPFCPSSDWSVGGPIIERERIVVACSLGEWWAFRALGDAEGLVVETGRADGRGPTPLVAAMRAYVASKYGETLDFPAT